MNGLARWQRQTVQPRLLVILVAILTFGAPEVVFASNQVLPVAAQQAPTFNLTYFTGESSAQLFLISADGKNITAAWKSFAQEIYSLRAASSTDGGATFSSPKTIASNSGAIIPLQMEVSGSTVVVLWLVETNDGSDLYLARSIDGGSSYSTPVNVSRNPQTLSNQSGSMIVDGSKITVFWGENDGFAGIHTASSFDGGLTFGDILPLSNRPGGSVNGPWIAQGPTGHLYAAWSWEEDQTRGIDFTRSTDHGMTFEPPTDVLPGHCCMRTLLANDSVIFLQSAWQPLISSSDGGQTWQSHFPEISTLSTTVLTNFSLYVDGWIWHAETSTYSVHTAHSSDGGATFLNHELGVLAGQCGWGKGTSAFGLSAATWWIDTVPGEYGCSASDIRDLVVSTSTDGGQSFVQPVRFSVGFSGRFEPSVFVDSKRVVVVWTSFTGANDTDVPLYFSYSTDGGIAFSTELLVSGLTETGFFAAAPFATTQGGDVIHIITKTSEGLVILSEIVLKEEEVPIFRDGFED